LHTDEELDKIEQLISIVETYCSNMTIGQKPTGSDELQVGQQVLARSSVNGGSWCNAVVISTGHR